MHSAPARSQFAWLPGQEPRAPPAAQHRWLLRTAEPPALPLLPLAWRCLRDCAAVAARCWRCLVSTHRTAAGAHVEPTADCAPPDQSSNPAQIPMHGLRQRANSERGSTPANSAARRMHAGQSCLQVHVVDVQSSAVRLRTSLVMTHVLLIC